MKKRKKKERKKMKNAEKNERKFWFVDLCVVFCLTIYIASNVDGQF